MVWKSWFILPSVYHLIKCTYVTISIGSRHFLFYFRSLGFHMKQHMYIKWEWLHSTLSSEPVASTVLMQSKSPMFISIESTRVLYKYTVYTTSGVTLLNTRKKKRWFIEGSFHLTVIFFLLLDVRNFFISFWGHTWIEIIK